MLIDRSEVSRLWNIFKVVKTQTRRDEKKCEKRKVENRRTTCVILPYDSHTLHLVDVPARDERLNETKTITGSASRLTRLCCAEAAKNDGAVEE